MTTCIRTIAKGKASERTCPRKRESHDEYCDRCLKMASVQKLLKLGSPPSEEAVDRNPEARQCKRMIRKIRQCTQFTVLEHGYCTKCGSMKSILKLLLAESNAVKSTRLPAKNEHVVDARPVKSLENFKTILDYPEFYLWKDTWITHLRLDQSLIVCGRVVGNTLAVLGEDERKMIEEEHGAVAMTSIPSELANFALEV